MAMGDLADLGIGRFDTPNADLRAASDFMTGGVPDSALVRDRTKEDPWKAYDDEQLAKTIAPDTGMAYGTTTQQEAPYTEKPVADAMRDWYVPNTTWGAGLQAAGATALSNMHPMLKMGAMAAGFALTPTDAEAMFAGPKAKTANLAKLAEAEAMFGKGHGADNIWEKTGWFKGAGGKWRYEVPDNESRWIMSPAEIRGRGEPVAMGDAFHHPELYKAYPELAGVDLNVSGFSGRGARGSYQSGGTYDAPTINLKEDSPARMRSTNLHEMMHGVQDIEGFPVGGNNYMFNPKSEAWGIYQDRLKDMRTPLDRETYGKVANFPDGIVPDKDWKAYLKIVRTGVPGSERLAQQYALDTYYKRLAGEVEARNVQKRADYTPDERRDIPPSWSQEYPNSDQFVKYRMGDLAEQQMSVKPTLDSVRSAIDVLDRNAPSPQDYHRIASRKLTRPLSSIAAQTKGGTPAVPVKTPADVEGSVFTPLVGDPTSEGVMIKSIDGTPLSTPLLTRGGHGYIRRTGGYANDTPMASTIANRVKGLSEYFDTDKIFGTHTKMGPQSGNFSHHTWGALARMLPQSQITRAGKGELNDAIMSEIAAIAPTKGMLKNKETYDWPKWPGVGYGNLEQHLAAQPDAYRKAFISAMEKSQGRIAGVPDPVAVRTVTSDPALLNAPAGASGLSNTRLTGIVRPSTHPDFPTHLEGEQPFTFGRPIPKEVMFPDVIGRFAKEQPPDRWARKMYMPPSKYQHGQEATSRWVDDTSGYLENANQMGEVAAFDKFIRNRFGWK